MAKLIDMTGQRFGRLTVIGRAEHTTPYENKHAWWKCRCDCGEEVEISGMSLRRGFTQSCGCLRKENGMKQIQAILDRRRERGKGNGEKTDSD